VSGFFELADVSARDKRPVAGACHDHDAHIGIVAQFNKSTDQSLPHLDRHRIPFFRIVEGYEAYPVDNAQQYLAVSVSFISALGDIQDRRRPMNRSCAARGTIA
jgi:hypothetical protein